MDELRRQDDFRMKALEDECHDIRLDIRTIKENHLAHIERDLSSVSNDMEWIKRFFWILATASIGSLVANILSAVS